MTIESANINSEHLLLLTPGFPADENDFITIPPLQEFLSRYKSTYPKARIDVIAFQYPYKNKSYEWNGIQVHSLAGKNSKIKKTIIWLRAVSLAKKINRTNNIDVIHSLWLGECALVGNILSKQFNCKHICTLMGQDVKSSNRYLRLSKNKKIVIVALSKNQADEFYRITGRAVDQIIHWGIDYQPVNNTERDIDLFAAGSLIPLKNYSLLIRTVEEIIKVKPDVKCILAGAGPEELKLKSLVKEKGLEKNITFTGLLNRREIFKLMQRSKIFVHPSTFEGSGYVFAEALANGMNIVSFNVGYAHEHPKWFIAEDEQDFINQSTNLLASELDYRPIDYFKIKKTIQDYAALYGIKH